MHSSRTFSQMLSRAGNFLSAAVALWAGLPGLTAERVDRSSHILPPTSSGTFNSSLRSRNVAAGSQGSLLQHATKLLDPSAAKAFCQQALENYYEPADGGATIGQGSFGVVSRVRLKKTLDLYAMKSIPVNKFSGKELWPMTLGLPFNMPLRSVLKSNDETNYHIVMPLLNGGDLEMLEDYRFYANTLLEEGLLERFAKNNLPLHTPPVSKEELLQIAWGLFHLHASGAVHRDVKGMNVMRSGSTGLMLVMDYGLTLLSDKGPAAAYRDNDFPDQVSGSPRYISPERWQRKKYGGNADFYSFGLMVFQNYAGSQLYSSSYFFQGTSKKYPKTENGNLDKSAGENLRHWIDSNLDHVTQQLGFPENLRDFLRLLLIELQKENWVGAGPAWALLSRHPVLHHPWWMNRTNGTLSDEERENLVKPLNDKWLESHLAREHKGLVGISDKEFCPEEAN